MIHCANKEECLNIYIFNSHNVFRSQCILSSLISNNICFDQKSVQSNNISITFFRSIDFRSHDFRSYHPQTPNFIYTMVKQKNVVIIIITCLYYKQVYCNLLLCAIFVKDKYVFNKFYSCGLKLKFFLR